MVLTDMIISLLYSVYFRFNEYSYKFEVLEIHYPNLCVWFDWWNLKIIEAYLWILRLVTSMILQANPSLNLTWLVFFFDIGPPPSGISTLNFLIMKFSPIHIFKKPAVLEKKGKWQIRDLFLFASKLVRIFVPDTDF